MMNGRERKLVPVLGAVVGVGVIVIAGYSWFIKPLAAYNKTIRDMTDERDLEALKWQTFVVEHKKLELARLRSLPASPSDAQSIYNHYLAKTVKESGLELAGITPAAPTKVKPTGTVPGIKEVGHQVQAFTLNARGELPELLKMMEAMQTTPYEHRIRSLNIDRIDASAGKDASRKLNITMIVEALLVAHTENRAGQPPGANTEAMFLDMVAGQSGFAPSGWALIGNRAALSQANPAPANRRYADVGRKNVFTGLVPIEKGLGGFFGKKAAPGKGASPADIPRFIRLVHTIPTHQEAYLLNLFYRNEEMKLSANPKTGYQVRRISDDRGDNVICFIKVLRVDSGVVYFQVKDDVYSITLGQTLENALKEEPYSTEELSELDLMPDPNFGKDNMNKRSR